MLHRFGVWRLGVGIFDFFKNLFQRKAKLSGVTPPGLASPKSELWVSDESQRSLLGHKVEDVVEAYSLFLQIRYPDHHKHFEARLKNDPDAARAEAVVFSWLRLQGHRPQIAESPAMGGMDYLCEPEFEEPFLVEVTALNRDAVELRSGWPDKLSEVAGSFSMITPSLWSKALHKAPQLAGQDVPRVLAICLTHIGASALLGTLAAKWLMMSEPQIEVPIALQGELPPARNVTNLKRAAFFNIQDGAVVPVRQSISAILLIAIWNDLLEVVGMLHPAASVPFDYRTFGDVPFLRAEWPIKDKAIRMEWVAGHPKPGRFCHRKVTMTEAELRGK
jgi:hypothetical protein